MFFAKRLPALIAGLTLMASAAEAEIDGQLAVAIGTPGSESFTFGTELWAMGQIALFPEHGITLASREVTADEDRLSLLQKREVEAALVYGRVPNAYDDDVRAILALWPDGVSSEDADPVQFLVHKDVSADVVYLVTKAMFENPSYFKIAHASLGIGLPGEAMTGLDIPLHAGAFRFYEENGFGLEDTVAADYWDTTPQPVAVEGTAAAEKIAGAASTFSNFDDAALDPAELDQIAAACRQALEVGALSLVLGDLEKTGCEVYQEKLTENTAGGHGDQLTTSVQTEQMASDVDDLEEASLGQGGPAIRWTPAEKEEAGTDWKPLPMRLTHQPTM